MYFALLKLTTKSFIERTIDGGGVGVRGTFYRMYDRVHLRMGFMKLREKGFVYFVQPSIFLSFCLRKYNKLVSIYTETIIFCFEICVIFIPILRKILKYVPLFQPYNYF